MFNDFYTSQLLCRTSTSSTIFEGRWSPSFFHIGSASHLVQPFQLPFQRPNPATTWSSPHPKPSSAAGCHGPISATWNFRVLFSSRIGLHFPSTFFILLHWDGSVLHCLCFKGVLATQQKERRDRGQMVWVTAKKSSATHKETMNNMRRYHHHHHHHLQLSLLHISIHQSTRTPFRSFLLPELKVVSSNLSFFLHNKQLESHTHTKHSKYKQPPLLHPYKTAVFFPHHTILLEWVAVFFPPTECSHRSCGNDDPPPSKHQNHRGVRKWWATNWRYTILSHCNSWRPFQ